MSMLTPPGMGGKYRIKGDKYPRMRPRRRRGRLVLATTASAVVLGVLGWGTLQLVDVFTGGGKEASAAGPKADCSTRVSASASATAAASAASAGSAAKVPKPAQITVNVYNATPRSGLAKDTADELKKRGFKIGDVGNAAKEFDKKVKGAGILLGPVSSLKTSLPVLATQLAGAERRTDASRKGADVDLIIGTGFTSLAKQADATEALAALGKPVPAPTSSKKGC